MEPEINLSIYKPSYWLPLFRAYCLKTRIIKANLRFFQYLSSDGIFIHPKYRKPHSKNHDSINLDMIDETPTKNLQQGGSTSEAISNQNNEDFSSNADQEQEDLSYFPEFDSEIEKVFAEFDNKVFVKLNWKAPKDIETWVPRLQSLNIEDLLMSLKSSTIIGEMLENCFPKLQDLKKEQDLEDCGGLEIVLKKWYEINKAMEFRVFIKKQTIRAICQRYLKSSYTFLMDIGFQDKIKQNIKDFFNLVVKTSGFKDENFVMDVYIEVKSSGEWRNWLLDLNPWGNFTNPLLFEWDELEETIKEEEFRVVKKSNEITLEKNTGICQMPLEFQGEVTEENVKKWLETIREDKNGIE